MKFLNYIFICFFITLSSCSLIDKNSIYYGVYTSKEKNLIFEFKKDNTFISKETDDEGFAGKYRIDGSELILILDESSKTFKGTIYAIGNDAYFDFENVTYRKVK